MQWMELMADVQRDHWRTLRVTIQVRDRLMAGKPARLDAANAMIKARGLEDVIEARLEAITDPSERAKLADQVQDEGLCEFHRREGKTGIWMPTNNVKAGLKENWSVLGLRVEHRGSRGALAEGVFVYSPPSAPDEAQAERDWVFLGSRPHDIYLSVSHTTGPTGPVSSIKRNEFVVRPRLTFDIAIAQAIAQKLPDDGLARTLYHFGEHGLGACRSQGFGRFDVIGIEEIDTANGLLAGVAS
jgi:hypothetical protein